MALGAHIRSEHVAGLPDFNTISALLLTLSQKSYDYVDLIDRHIGIDNLLLQFVQHETLAELLFKPT